ncbi:MAG: Fe-S protein assembly chaperone HscA [Bacteroidia bacterium]
MARIKINIKDGSIQRNDKVLGIDLGTTNSLIAIVNQESKQAECLGENGSFITPSIIYFDQNNSISVGDDAKIHLTESSSNTVYSVKRLLGRSYTDIADHASHFGYHIIPDNTKAFVNIEINGKVYNPIELSSYILKSLKNKAEKILGESIRKAVITVPAYFNDSQRQATRDAGKLAGLDVLRIVNEPTAASLAYGIGLDKEHDKTIAVYDLGGGTFDITILHIQNGVFEVLSTNGDTYTGGDDFDRCIIEHWCTQLNLEISDIEANKSLYQNFRLKAEQAKIAISDDEKFETDIELDTTKYKLEISRKDFNQAIDPILSKTIQACAKAIKDAEISIDEIDEVVMVGGSTRIPFVNEKVKTFFKKDKLKNSLNQDQVVALGAAIEADILAGNRKDILLLDVTPLSLGIETMGGLMDVIIPRNSKIPSAAGRQYTTSKDGQSKLKITVYQGERELVGDNRKLGEFVLENIPAMPAGLPKIDIRFLLDADGILKVEAKEMRSGVQQEITIQPQYGLTDKEVETMLLSAMQFAESDMHERELAELKIESAQVVYQSKKIINANNTLLNNDEISETKSAIETLERVCQENDKQTIIDAMERLNTITRPFAERLMDEAIGKALTGKKLDSL